MSDVLLWTENETPLLKRGHVALLRGPTGAAKTRLVIRMMIRLASGMPWIGGIQGRINGRIAFVSLKDSVDDIRRMIFEERDWAGVAQSDLRGKIELFFDSDWREQISEGGHKYGLVIIDDAMRDGHCGPSLDDAHKYVRELEEFTMWTLGRPACVVVQGIVNGTMSLYPYTQCCFDVLAPTCALGVAKPNVAPWVLELQSSLAYGLYRFPFVMTDTGIKEC
jgi:hypothetical protein